MKKTTYLFTMILALPLLFTACRSVSEQDPTPSANSNTAQSTATSSSLSSQASSQPAATSEENSFRNGVKLSLAKAIAAAEKIHQGAVVTGIDLDTSFGNYYYEINSADDNYEYEVKIDANDGSTIEDKKERLDADERNGVKAKEDGIDTSKLLSLDKITSAAEEAAGSGSATDWSLDKDMGVTYWEVKIKRSGRDTEVKINAETGEILEMEEDD